MTTNHLGSVWVYPRVSYLPFDPMTALMLRVMGDYSRARTDLDALMVKHRGH